MNWISVKDKLPEDYSETICISKGGEYMIGYIWHSSGPYYFCESDGVLLKNVTHWMPLPEPPKQ